MGGTEIGNIDFFLPIWNHDRPLNLNFFCFCFSLCLRFLLIWLLYLCLGNFFLEKNLSKNWNENKSIIFLKKIILLLECFNAVILSKLYTGIRWWDKLMLTAKKKKNKNCKWTWKKFNLTAINELGNHAVYICL